MFPHHPLTNVRLPHHIYAGALVALLAVAVVWDDERDREPLVTAAGVVVAVYAFVFLWPYYHRVGAAVTVVSAGLAAAAPVAGPFWRGYGWARGYRPGPRLWAAVGGYVMVDDAVAHAFGWLTPGDAVWYAVVHPVLSMVG
ncbi:hypothetical protein [Halorarius halobius]|uniref:hypothetical protein n=1 Tax=Halorarius halobius TaxID=2962671 RepID=UPI0020CC3641|nr:hypothetical protein [Halorarius halobius]